MSFRRDWSCDKCSHVVSDVPTSVQEQTCPKCGGEMKKIYTSPFVLFKGSGWTQTFHGQTRVIRDDQRHEHFDKDWKKIANMEG